MVLTSHMKLNPEMLKSLWRWKRWTGIISPLYVHFVYWAQRIHRRILCTIRCTVQYIRFKHNSLIIVQNQLHAAANIEPSSGWLEKKRRKYLKLQGFEIPNVRGMLVYCWTVVQLLGNRTCSAWDSSQELSFIAV